MRNRRWMTSGGGSLHTHSPVLPYNTCKLVSLTRVLSNSGCPLTKRLDRDGPYMCQLEMKQLTLDGDPIEGEHVCPTCGKPCDNRAGMHRHHMWVHGTSISVTNHTCDKCGRERELYVSEAELLTCGLCVHCARERPTNHDEEARRKMSEAQQGRSPSQETLEKLWAGWREWFENGGREELSEKLKGREVEHDEESRAKISETLTGHEVSEETRQKIRENLDPVGVQQIEVERTGHVVKSGWEEEMDLLLHHSPFDYGYESRKFDLQGYMYTPDFFVGDYIIEVKGRVWEKGVERAEKFMEHYPSYTYVVVGTELPSDIHISWDSRARILDILG